MIKYINLGLIFLTLFVTTPSWSVTPVPGDASPILNMVEFPYQSFDYNKMFEYTRELLTRPPVKAMLKDIFADELKVTPALAKKLGLPAGGIKEMSEAQFMLLLEQNKAVWPMLDQYIKEVPRGDVTVKTKALHKKWHDKFKVVMDDPVLKAKLKKINDPLKPFILQTADGSAGYANPQLYSDTPLIHEDGSVTPPTDLEARFLKRIDQAKEEMAMNFYDWDLEKMTDAVIAKAATKSASGKPFPIRVGVYRGNLEGKAAPEATIAQFKRLVEASKKYPNLKPFSVDAVLLDHSKLISIDWSVKGKGAITSSSGNATQSCVGPEGDLCGTGIKSEFSIPNANHIVELDSDVSAQLANHELTKIMDMGLRGKEYPLSGTWQVFGEGKGVKIADRDYFIAAFTPNGAVGDINRQMISEMIRQRKGELRALQFAFSSEGVDDALYEAAIADIKKTGTFKFRSVGDTPMAAREWSVFVDMLGFEKDAKSGVFKLNPTNRWNKLPEKVKAILREQIKAAPTIYGTHQVAGPDGKKIEVTSKIHDKVIMDDEKGFFGTSFNFSENAEGNNEVILMFKDKNIIKQGHAMFEGLYKDATVPLYNVLMDKNNYLEKGPALKSDKCKVAGDEILKAIAGKKKKAPSKGK